MRKFYLFIVLGLFAIPFVVSAHSGGTDARGGHSCWTDCELYGLQSGEYHFHDDQLNPIATYERNTSIYNKPMAERLHGNILLQVESVGEAWFVNHGDSFRYYMRDGSVAYEMMRSFGLGITNEDLLKLSSVGSTDEMSEVESICATDAMANRLKGRILLQVEDNGEAWYIDPAQCYRIYIQNGDEAYQVMRFLGLGVTNADLSKIAIAGESALSDFEIKKKENPYIDIEMRVFALINAHRESIGAQALEWNQNMSDIARPHSVNMATGAIVQSHEGFSDRFALVKEQVPDYNGGAENLAWNYSSDPAQQALTWWLGSPGHKATLENDFYDLTGVGVAKASDGKYYITQLFANIDVVMMEMAE